MAIGKYLSDGNPDGTAFGQSTSDLISLYGGTAVSQRAAAAQATSLIGTASTTAMTTDHKAFLIEVGNTLTAIGAWKGSA
jgi:hypothetical protein